MRFLVAEISPCKENDNFLLFAISLAPRLTDQSEISDWKISGKHFQKKYVQHE